MKANINIFKEKLNIPDNIINNAINNLNPLSLAISKEFEENNVVDFRSSAIDLCINNKIDFNSECNSIEILFNKLFKVFDPISNSQIKFSSSSSTNNKTTLVFSNDSIKIQISLNPNDINVNFKS